MSSTRAAGASSRVAATLGMVGTTALEAAGAGAAAIAGAARARSLRPKTGPLRGGCTSSRPVSRSDTPRVAHQRSREVREIRR